MQSKNNTKQRNASIQGLRSFKDTLPKQDKIKGVKNEKIKKSLTELTRVFREK